MFTKIKKAQYIGDYKIKLLFEDGNEGIVDLSNSLEGKIFESLKDKNFFARFKLDEELGTVVWENGADFAPEYLYYLAFKDREDLQKKIRQWHFENKEG
ncbi:DUF2442 domain-containing protein [Thermodesulfatator atlanticus]|uniref:DUF2442 domain-containing protein n=1 Tax=Thermodesulfatator atlanticus TaxID=501497 RepID=UPI0003B3149C|nr:DUF2442 domain-containing protein [Thermodesulfatator atlanticus]